MRDELAAVLRLQGVWIRDNTPEMEERGKLIRHALPSEVRRFEGRLRAALGPFGEEFDVEGSDGTGLKARVPWVRYFCRPLAQSATEGWYCVYLFRPDGAGVSLCLSHGSTSWDGGLMTVRSDGDALRLRTWAQNLLRPDVDKNPTLELGIKLGSRAKLARAYEKTTAVSRFYPASSLPSEGELERDAELFARMLRGVYDHVVAGSVPGEPSLETVALAALAESLANPLRPTRSGGQGFGLSAAERAVVERRAMKVAEEWLTANGYQWNDVHKKMPYDYIATQNGKKFIAEVKGTTGTPSAFFLTANEVDAHARHYPDNFLMIVHGIVLSKNRKKATGGTLLVKSPWQLESERLKALSYQYRLT